MHLLWLKKTDSAGLWPPAQPHSLPFRDMDDWPPPGYLNLDDWTPAKDVARRLAAIERYNADGQVFGNLEWAPILIGLLDWIARNPESNSEYEAVFVDYVDHNKTPEVLEFCMHHLRYPRVRERVEEIRDRAPDTPRGYDSRRLAQGILDAYSDDWADSDIWPPYPPAQ
jgi:hypothetical protein